MDSIANYCYWLWESVFPHKMVTGIAADTLSETEAAILGDEGTCGKSSEGKEGNSDIIKINYICEFLLFCYLLTLLLVLKKSLGCMFASLHPVIVDVCHLTVC
jgi:hypothetical protein